MAFHHERYKEHVLDLVKTHGLDLVAPVLRKGDVLFWNSRTIHGSLPTTAPGKSRRSLTAHFIPVSCGFTLWGTHAVGLSLSTFEGMSLHHPKDPRRLRNRVRFLAEAACPPLYRWLRKFAIKTLVEKPRRSPVR